LGQPRVRDLPGEILARFIRWRRDRKAGRR